LLCLLATAPSLHAQTIRLELSLTVRRSPQSVHITGIIHNRGQDPAYEVKALLRGVDAAPRPVIGELGPGERAEIAWEVDPERWRMEMREIAALRIRYHDVAGTWAGSVTVVGPEADATVEGPAWPDDPRIEVAWRETADGGRAVWWSPVEIELEGIERWRSDDGTAIIEGRLRPATDITGWETSGFLLVLPDDPGVPGKVVSVRIDARSFRSLWRPDLPLLAGWAVLCLIAWLGLAAVPTRARSRLGAGRSSHPTCPSRLLASAPAFATALCLGTAGLMIFPPHLLLLDTTPAGGDYASHIVALDQLREVLLPSGQVYGWSMDQYAGFPLFLFYFPLAFLVLVLLSVALPLTVAMKIGSLAGALLLPVAWYLSLRWLDAPRPARWLAPVAALAFLLIETQSTWGGNLASLLAGEFAYALGFPLAWLAVTHAWKTRDRASGWWPAAVLLALAGLAHGYALVCAALGIGLLALHPRLWWRRGWHVARIGLVAFGLLAWWLVPLLWNLPWTTGFREQWEIGGMAALFPPAIAIAGVLLIAGVARRLLSRDRPALAPGQAWLMGFAAVLFVFYRLGFSLGVVDVRFLPMMHGAILLAGCYELGAWIALAKPDRRPALAAAVIILVSTAAVAAVEYVPSWVRWNMSGMERTSGWPDYHGAMRAIAGDIDEPRVAWEHHPDHNEAGTIRAFEMIPWFAGRATLEGLYFQSTVLAPAIFYLQSEISLRPSCPLPAFECGRFDPAAAVEHLELLGASELIAYTDSLARTLERSAEFQERARSGVYEVFALVEPPSLVEPVGLQPVVDTWPDWRAEAYDWFRAGTDLEVPLVLDDGEGRAWPSVDRYRPRRLPRIPYATRPRVSATILDQAIRIETDAPGHPLLVKVGYHPGWRASDGSVIDLVAPGMMLVTPRSRSFTLEWSAGWPGRLGVVLTALTILALLVGVTRQRRDPGPPGWRLPEARRAGWVGIAALSVLAIATALVMLRRHPPLDYAALLAEGQRRLSDGRFSEAGEIFRRMLSVDTPHTLRDDAAFYQALVALEAGDDDAALRRLRIFLHRFPVSTYRGEALIRLSDLHADRGEAGRALQALEEARITPLTPEHWLAAARGRLERPEGSNADLVPPEIRS
ncbi:MAG: 6-pyruvoyl-tetrahydropterin synthase-related protein, partial [Gemmatimonadota bacterium]